MRLDRFLIPAVAAIVVVGVLVALGVALSRSGPPTADPKVTELLALKSEAEELAIARRLPEAHAKYRELFQRAQAGDIRDPHFWDLLERAKNDQDYVYRVLLAEQDSTRAVSGRPATQPAGPTTPPATTQSFVDTYPPYRNLTTNPTTVAAETPRASAGSPATTAASSRPPANDAAAAPNSSAQADAVVASLPEPKRINVTRTPRDTANFSDAAIGYALAQANEFLLAQFKDGEIQQGKELSESYRQGLNALVVYALINSGQATRDPRLQPAGEFAPAAVEKIKLHPMSTDTSKAQQPVVYARSLRAQILATANRPEDRDVLKDDVKWLIDAAVDGAYSYDDRAGIRIEKADPRNAPGRGMQDRDMPPPAGLPGQNQPRPKTMGQPRGQQAPPPAPAPVNGEQGGKSARLTTPRITSQPWAAWRGEVYAQVVAEDRKPLPEQFADGYHDPRTGAELGPPGMLRYPPPPPPPYPPQELPDKYAGPFAWDNSNSQYGLAGVAAGAEVGVEVPDAYWAAVEKHWMACQLTSGEWPYRKDVPGGRMSMTCGGIASLLATHDFLEAPTVAKVGRQPSPAIVAINNGFVWLEAADNAINVAGPRMVYLGYNLHALGRVGLASGYKYFGSHDWYRYLARQVVLSQWANGSWGRSDQPTADTLIDTAYSVLFLARGRHPVMMNKLRLDSANGRSDRGEWNNRPRDLANLTRFASRELERPVNWQVVPVDREADDWSDSPILYVASHSSLKLSDRDVGKIRAFVDGGGMLFTQADTNADAFNVFVTQLAKRLFPEFEFKPLSPDDELYTLQYIIPKPSRPRLTAIHNGSRLLWVHSPTDLAVHWQQRAEKTRREAFELGVNLFVYAGGKTDLRNRVDDRAIPPANTQPSSTIRLARLKYSGNWNPEPAAWPRFARLMLWETSLGIDPTPVEIHHSSFSIQNFPLAHLTGTAAYTPTDAELTALRTYVESGGTLIVEAVGGADSTFADALQSTILPKAFPAAKFAPLPTDHPMLHATFKGMEDVYAPKLRQYAVQKLGKTVPPIRLAQVGKGRVIYLPLDTTSGLLGSNTWSILGYDAAEAQALMKNIILWCTENPT